MDTWQLSSNGLDVLVQGTPVWILGAYDFDRPPPWRRLPVDPAVDRITEEEVHADASAAVR